MNAKNNFIQKKELLIRERRKREIKYRGHNWVIWRQDLSDLKYVSAGTSELSDLVLDVKDNFVIQGVPTTAGSLILSHYVPTYTATAVKRLLEYGAVLYSKSNMDEFGHSGTGANSVYGDCLTPENSKYLCGGSSGGGAALVATKIVDFSLCSDTGDSARIPALNCGVHGFKPSWGRISRYGLIPYAPSLDTPSLIARNIGVIARIFTLINGFDVFDITTSKCEKTDYEKQLDQIDKSSIQIFVPQNLLQQTKLKNKDYYRHFNSIITKLESKGCQIHIEEFVDTKDVPVIYQIIANCEAISSSACLTANTFGQRADTDDKWKPIFTKSRTNSISIWTKFRWINGAIAATNDNFDLVYKLALRARRALTNEVRSMFSKYEVFLFPVNMNGPKLQKDIVDNYLSCYTEEDDSTHLIVANLTGIPSAVITTGRHPKTNMPIGVAVYANYNNDLMCLQFAKMIEELVSE